VSTSEQDVDLQRNALVLVRCDQVYEDFGISVIAKSRPSFESAMAYGDVLVIWKFGRAFRSVRNALNIPLFTFFDVASETSSSTI